MVTEVVIVEDDLVFRDNLAMVLDGEPDLQCRAVFGSVEQLLAAPLAIAPDIILLDIHLPGITGSAGVAILTDRFPRAAIVMLTVEEHRERVFEAVRNGARGYLLKRTAPARLVEHVRAARDGGAPMSAEIAAQVLEVFRTQRIPDEHALSPREVEVLRLIGDGYSYLNAAGQLGISINTVRNHVRSVYDKLHVNTKSEAVAKAYKLGLLR